MFSICIPSFEDLDYLKLCLKSLEENSYYNHEVCISYSDDKIGNYLNNLNFNKLEIKTIKINEDPIFCVPLGYNAAVSLATEPYIIIADSDHVYIPEWDNRIVKLMFEHTYNAENNIIYSMHRIETDKFGITPNTFKYDEFIGGAYNDYLRDDVKEPDIFHPFVMEKSLWQKSGGMSLTFPSALHDDELWWRIYKLYKPRLIYTFNTGVFHFSGHSRDAREPRKNREITEPLAVRAPEIFKFIYGFDWIPAQKLYEVYGKPVE
jgi:glycosyltransferase involved in cell wall biosynthesis